MSDPSRRDRLIQDHLAGEIDRAELRDRLSEEDAERLPRELAAYRAVWEGLAQEPEWRPSLDLEGRLLSHARGAGGAGRWEGVPEMAASLGAAAAGATAIGLLLPLAGVEPAALLDGLAGVASDVPAAGWASAGAAVALFVADRIWLTVAGG